jgi:hypothetical protein
VSSEATVHVIAWEDLFGTDLPAPGAARGTDAARNDRWDHDARTDPGERIRPGINDCAADLVTECQRERMAGWDAVVKEAQVGMTDAACGNLDQDLVRLRNLVADLVNHWLAGPFNHPRSHLHATSSLK